jgi:hypothetical protein
MVSYASREGFTWLQISTQGLRGSQAYLIWIILFEMALSALKLIMEEVEFWSTPKGK